MFSAAILAGGHATRFGGRDKSALVVDGQTILQRQVATLRAVAGLQEILLVGRAAPLSGVRSIADRVPDCGPLGGIHAALSDALCDTVFVLACDMPHVTAALITYLVGLSDDVELVVPQTEAGYHPLCAVYSRGCLAEIGRRLDERRLKVFELADEIPTRVVSSMELDRFGDRHRLLSNVNTPSDYAAHQQHQLDHQL
jgi:molybdopterin-guanine dinucleotide biosynthesis protein A